MYSIDLPECSVFRALRKDIIADLIGNGIPSSYAGAIVKFYDPVNDEYLDRVSAWQSLLCTGTCSDVTLIPKCFSESRWVVCTSTEGIVALNMPPYIIDQINGVVQLVYKFHSKPRKEMDLEAVKRRLSRPGQIALTQDEVERARKTLMRLPDPPSWHDLVGKYGPGVTSERLSQFDRWSWKGQIPARVPLELWPDAIRSLIESGEIETMKYGITRIACVPKSLKTDRTVSSEPACFMFAQKAVGDFMRDALCRTFPREIHLRDRFAHNKLLTDHEVYREQCSRIVRYGHASCAATLYYPAKYDCYTSIDLSDASDHVSRRLVALLMPPNWKDYLFSVRSTFASFPDGSLVPLRTFAPMGSDVCFPVLTAVCYALCKSLVGKSRIGVFGDDIIVPLRYYDACVDLLTRAGLVVNTVKSGTVGRYTESCGQEFYRSSSDPLSPVFEVTATRMKCAPDKVDAATLDKWFHNWDRMNWVHVEDTVWQLSHCCTRIRWNSALQRQEVLTRKRVPIIKGEGVLEGHHGFIRWYCLRTQRDDGQSDDIYTPSGRTRLQPCWLPLRDLPHLTRFITR